ncbi:MAG: tryptophan synthase subunit alpha, partial [Proteobacteria bacterium]|nr:tryptophan synthase subunit alpha [Pseudomonadota bacterium]
SAPFRREEEQASIDLVLVLPLHADRETVIKVAGKSRGYLYLLSRKGVTGVDQEAGLPSRDLMRSLKNLNAAPPVLGFGVSTPEQVSAALEAGCRGVISGSAVVQRVEDYVTGKAPLEDLFAFIRKMKDATR